ncbi:MAG TPA: EamA family transporter [Candidatus Thermoplasmatota archaeon]|nr:EamA family transporter [Candidatus Thermoplasmatota archaeon]
MRAEALPFAAFAGASLIWGTTFYVVRLGVATVPPLWAAALRLILASVLLLALMAALRIRVPRGRVLGLTALFGVLDFGVAFSLLYWAEQHVTGGVAATVFATLPLLTAVLAWTIKLEVLSLRKLVGAIASFAGVALMFAAELQRDVPLAGLLAVFGAALAMAAGTIVLKRTPARPVVMTNAIGAAVGALVCVLGSFAMREPHALPRTAAAWGPIVYLALAGSLGAFLLFTWVTRKWNATSASMIFVVLPVLAMILDAATGTRVPSLAALAGALLVLAGVTVVLLAPNADAVPQLHPRPRAQRVRVPVVDVQAERAGARRPSRVRARR